MLTNQSLVDGSSRAARAGRGVATACLLGLLFVGLLFVGLLPSVVGAQSAQLTVTALSRTTATLELSGHTGDWWHDVKHGTCSNTGISGTTLFLTGLTPETTYLYTAWPNDRCEPTSLQIAEVQFTTTAVGLTATNVTVTTASLNIINHTTAWWYTVELHDIADCQAVTASTTTVSLTGLSHNTIYTATAYSGSPCSNSNLLASQLFRTQTPSAPVEPTSPFAAASHEAVTLTWAARGDGGSTITKWQYQQQAGASPYGAWTDICLTSNDTNCPSTNTYTVTGLTNGTTYRFKVRAVNALGTGGASQPSAAVTVGSPPPAPGKPTVRTGNGQVALSASVSSTGHSAITKWQYQQKAGTDTAGAWQDIANSDASSLSHTVTGLTNGTAYTFKVRAVNNSGPGAASPVSDSVTPNVASLTADNITQTTATLRLSNHIGQWWYSPDGSTACHAVASGTYTADLTNLTAGTSYTYEAFTADICGPTTALLASHTFTTLATPPADPSKPTPPTPPPPPPRIASPPAPTQPTATGNPGQITLTWQATGTGGAPITKWQYQQKVDTGNYGPWLDIPDSGPATTSHTVTGLSNTTAYQFRVRAVNASGPGAASPASDPVRPLSAAEQALLTNGLAAQGRALLTGATAVIGQRFRASGPGGMNAGREGDGAAAALGTVARFLGLPAGRGEAPEGAVGAQDPLSADPGRRGPRRAKPAWTLDQLTGLAFALPLSAMGAKGLQGWTLWGAGATQRFEGAPDAGQYDGPLSSLYLGLDTHLSPAWLVGVAASHSWGTADYTVGETGGRRGRLETRLTSVYPYVQGTVAEGLELWALGGYGWGEVENRAEGPARSPEASDLAMAMGAAGLRQPLTERAGVQVALVGSGGYLALATETGLQAVDDLSAEVLQARVALEATRAFGALAPYLQVGGRADGGDGQTGVGLETVAGVRYTGERVTFEARGRWLATHSADGYEEYGGMARLAVQARPDGTGLRLRVAPSWGRAEATGALWGDGAPRLGGSALSTPVPRGAETAPALALASDLGYGVPLWTGTLTPSVAYGSTGGGPRASLGLAYASPPTAWTARQKFSLRLGYAPPPTVRAAADYRLEVLWSRGF